jgi:hypothetical protein
MKMRHLRELGLAVAVVALVAAGLGYWLFGPLGVALWVPVAAFVTALLYLLRGFSPSLAMAAPLLLAGAALYHASTLAWGGAEAPDGTRYKASPIGLSHVLSPRQPVSPTVNCRWYFAGGDADVCAMAPGAAAAYWQLLAVFPLICLSIVVCLLESLGQCRRGWRLRFPHRRVAGIAAGLPTLALLLFSRSLGPALAVLTNLEVGTGGTLGTMEVTAAILLGLAAGVVPPTPEWLSNQALNPTGNRPASSAGYKTLSATGESMSLGRSTASASAPGRMWP